MNKCLIVYIGIKAFATIDNKNIIEWFQVSTKWKIMLQASISQIYNAFTIDFICFFQLYGQDIVLD